MCMPCTEQLWAALFLPSWGPRCPGAPWAFSSVLGHPACPVACPAQGGARVPEPEAEAAGAAQIPRCWLGSALPPPAQGIQGGVGGVISWSAGAQNLVRGPPRLWGPKGAWGAAPGRCSEWRRPVWGLRVKTTSGAVFGSSHKRPREDFFPLCASVCSSAKWG